MQDDVSPEQDTNLNQSESGADTGKTAGSPAMPARRALMLGAVATSAIVSVRPAMAQTAYSAYNCEITVPSPQDGPVYVDNYGNIVDQNAPGATVLPPRTFTGQEVLEGRDRNAPRAYRDLIRRLKPGQSGFTCYASIQGGKL